MTICDAVYFTSNYVCLNYVIICLLLFPFSISSHLYFPHRPGAYVSSVASKSTLILHGVINFTLC